MALPSAFRSTATGSTWLTPIHVVVVHHEPTWWSTRILRNELSGAEGDHEDSLTAFDRPFRTPDNTPPNPAVVDRPCPSCGGPSAVLLERGRLVLACRTCPDPAELSWAPKKAKRRAAKKESSEKAASEQAAADQRLQARG